MAGLFETVRMLAALVLLATLADLMMPSGAMRKYARLVSGLLIMFTLIGAMLRLVGAVEKDALSAWLLQEGVGSTPAPRADAAHAHATEAWQRQYAQQALHVAQAQGIAAQAVEIEWDETGYPVNMLVIGQGTAEDERQLAQALGEALAAAPARVRIATERSDGP